MGAQNDAATPLAVGIGFRTIEICGNGANCGKFPRFFVASQAPLRQKRSPHRFWQQAP
jgi:hypothetical protein